MVMSCARNFFRCVEKTNKWHVVRRSYCSFSGEKRLLQPQREGVAVRWSIIYPCHWGIWFKWRMSVRTRLCLGRLGLSRRCMLVQEDGIFSSSPFSSSPPPPPTKTNFHWKPIAPPAYRHLPSSKNFEEQTHACVTWMPRQALMLIPWRYWPFPFRDSASMTIGAHRNCCRNKY